MAAFNVQKGGGTAVKEEISRKVEIPRKEKVHRTAEGGDIGGRRLMMMSRLAEAIT